MFSSVTKLTGGRAASRTAVAVRFHPCPVKSAVWFMAACVFFCCLAFSVAAETALPPYAAAELQALCRERGLGRSPEWLALGQYCGGLNGLRSLVDDPAFFVTPNGKFDPPGELEGFAAAILAPAEAGKSHAVDRFPARFEWLVSELALERRRLPVPQCRELEEIIAGIDPRGVVLVFPNAFMNSPASLFGHTLLAVRGADPELLNQAVSYAAVTTVTNGLLFAFNGIFGLSPGFYNVSPYYEKLQEYNDIEMRDVWEYHLNLSRAEVERLMRHVWEFRKISTRYFFFDENCALKLLFLLDVARPGLDLHRQARPWVIPLDTVRLVERAGLVAEHRYRASRATLIRRLAADAPPAVTAAAIELAEGRLEPENLAAHLPAATAQAAALDLAVPVLQARLAKRRLDQKTYSRRFLACLSARSRVPTGDGAGLAPGDEPPAPPRPDLGHGSARLAVGSGREDGRGYRELALRAAYHEGSDPVAGYIPGAEIEFCNLTLRTWQGQDRLHLQRLDIVRIRSLSARCDFFQPTSWEVDFSWKRDWVGRRRPGRFLHLGAGWGGTWQVRPDTYLYALGNGAARAGSMNQGWSAGAGLAAGGWIELGKRLKIQAEARHAEYLAGDRFRDVEFRLEPSFAFTPNLALAATLAARRVDGRDRSRAAISLRYYF